MSPPRSVTSVGRDRVARRRAPDDADAIAFRGLRWMTAGLFLATGAEAATSVRSAPGGPRPAAGALRALRFAPVILGPAAGAAHAARAIRPELESQRLARVLSGIAVGAAATAVTLALADALRAGDTGLGWRAGRRGRASAWLRVVAPLAFGATGLLGLVLDHEEREEADRQRRLRRRAKIVERLVPRRRPRLDRIVVHV